MPNPQKDGGMGKAWKLTLICYDKDGEIDDPDELAAYIKRFGYARAPDADVGGRIRCELVTPCAPVEEQSARFTFGG